MMTIQISVTHTVCLTVPSLSMFRSGNNQVHSNNERDDNIFTLHACYPLKLVRAKTTQIMYKIVCNSPPSVLEVVCVSFFVAHSYYVPFSFFLFYTRTNRMEIEYQLHRNRLVSGCYCFSADQY